MIETYYLESVQKRFAEHKALGEKALAQIKDADFHIQPNEASNSIAIIIQHLHGNMLSRWTNFLTEDGEKPWRKREEEFSAFPKTKKELLHCWEEGWRTLFETLSSLQVGDLLKTITIRSQPLTVIDAINRQLAHYSYHIGQIVYLARWINGDTWQSLSIPKGTSQQYNEQLMSSAK